MGSPLAAEFLGTVVVVLGGCGSAIFAVQVLNGDTVNMGIGFLGVALAYDLTVLVMDYTVGHLSGGRFISAVTFGAALAKRVEWKAVPAYVITQAVAASGAGWVLFAITSGKSGVSAVESGFASNSYGGSFL